MTRHWFALVLLTVLLIPSVAGPTGTLVIPVTIASLAAGNQPASLLDQNWTAIQSYVNAREITIGLVAARPAAGTAGRYFFATDVGGGALYADSGSAWQQIAPSLTASFAEALTGLGLSNAATNPSTTIGIATGAASSDDAAVSSRILMTLASAVTKTTAAWAVGSGNGCLDTGAVAVSTWYHVFLIQRTDTGVVDVLCSTSVAAPTMPTNYTKKRRLGAVQTDAGSALNFFTQDGDYFVWATVPALNVNVTNPGTAAISAGLSAVPLGLPIQAVLTVGIATTGVQVLAYFSDLAATDQAPSLTVAPLGQTYANTGPAFVAATVMVRTNAGANFRFRLSASDANVVLRATAGAWFDRRGRG